MPPARALVPVLAAALVLAGPAAARASDSPADLAAAVTSEVVHVDPRARGRVSVAEAGELRVRIAQRDPGRIKILVVPPVAAERSGGTATLANVIAQRARLRGALILVAGPDVRVSTSYDSGPAVAAVQEAMAGPFRRRIAGDLIAAIDGIARVDPGSAAGAGGPGGSDDLGFGDFLDDVGHAFKVVLFGVGGVLVLLLLTPLVIYGLRARRRRAEGAEELAARRADAREELVAVGSVLRELDLDAEMPGADPAGREALGAAIELYNRADRALAKATTPRRLERARTTLYAARDQAELARGRLTTLPPSQLSNSSGGSGRVSP